jgi:succinate-semialdehyde dehydrogenase / glutarate-semialdehyde dehydrogenase
MVRQQRHSTAGLPEGLFTTLLVAEADVPSTTERLIADPRIGAVTITGSERAGSAVGAIAGREIKKSVLELGGSDPFVVLADADLPRVAALAVNGRFLNTGQSCISPKRFIVAESVAEEFTKLVVEGTVALTIGNPEQPGTDVGPMARRDLRDSVAAQVRALSTRAQPCCAADGRAMTLVDSSMSQRF